MRPPGKRKLSCAKTNRWFYDEINWFLACFSGVRCCTSGLTSGMKPIQRRWSSWLMPRKSSIWQHSGAMEQRHRLTDRTFGGHQPRTGDSIHVLDSLLYHETDLEITEHYTDTAGFTCFRANAFARIRFCTKYTGLS